MSFGAKGKSKEKQWKISLRRNRRELSPESRPGTRDIPRHHQRNILQGAEFFVTDEAPPHGVF